MPKSNVRFVAIWAAFVPVILLVAALVPELGIAPWSTTQVTLVTAEVNAGSAVVLALVAYLWSHSVREPAAVQGTVSAFGVATLALGTGFGWWSLSDQATQLLVLLIAAVVVLALTIFNRQVAYAPETVDIEKAKAVTPAAVVAAMPEKLRPPSTPVPSAPEAGQVSWLMLAVVVAVVVLIIAVFWGWRP